MNKIWKLLSGKGSTAAYAVITAIFTVVPEDIFKLGFVACDWSEANIVLANRLIVCALVFVFINFGYYCHRKYRNHVTISNRAYSIKIEYANLFKIEDGKKVINFDECFSINVGNNPEDIKPESVCGQYLVLYPIDDMHSLIAEKGIKPTGTSKYQNKDSFAPGTILPKGEFLLMAFTKLDVEGRGVLTYDEYIACLSRLWEQIDLYHGTADVYLPVLGSRITRFGRDLTQQELLDIMIASYRLSPNKMKHPNVLHIVCKRRKGFSLNDIFGVY